MSWKFKKKKKPLSYADQQFVNRLIADAKAKRKTLHGYAILKRKESYADVKLSGVFKDIDELKRCANEFVQMLCEISKKHWEVLEIAQNGIEVYDDDKNSII